MTSSEVSIDFYQVLGHECFSPERSLNHLKATRVCIRSTNQSNRFISVRLLFLFCSRVFISRSYENHSKSFAVRCLVIAPVRNTKKLSKIPSVASKRVHVRKKHVLIGCKHDMFSRQHSKFGGGGCCRFD